MSVFFKSPSHSCQGGLFKFVILNEWPGAPAIITTVATAVSQKWIYLLQHPEAGCSTSRLLRVDIEMQRDIDYSIRNLILQVVLPSRGPGAQGEGNIKCQSWKVDQVQVRGGGRGNLGLVINNRE